MKKKLGFIFLISMMLLIIACGKPSVQNETNKYNHYQTNLKQMAAKYPAFHSFLVKISQNSHKFIKEADKIEDQVKKAEKIAESNKVFEDSTFYGQLNSFDGRVKSITKKRINLGKYYKKKHKTKVKNTISNADKALSKALEIMKNAKPENLQLASVEVKKANGVLIGVEHQLNSTARLIKRKSKPIFKIMFYL